MKRSLITLAFAGLLANVAFAQPTLTGDDTLDQVHLTGWRGAPEATSYEVVAQSNTYENDIYSFNP